MSFEVTRCLVNQHRSSGAQFCDGFAGLRIPGVGHNAAGFPAFQSESYCQDAMITRAIEKAHEQIRKQKQK